jgi:phosphate acetyltransferase/phosphate butyryltransferase
VHPVDSITLLAAVEAAKANLIVPVLVGPEAKIQAAAAQAQIELAGLEIVPAEHSHAAAETAVRLARDLKVDALMRGALHTDELLQFVDSPQGIRTERHLSHVFALDVPASERALFLTDALRNITPGLEQKRDIIQNAVDLAHALGLAAPKVAILSSQEMVSPKLVSTLDAAVLCKMADRGQITGAVLDGPLAFDVAFSEEAAKAKGVTSSVAGKSDIFLVPNLEAGNILVKQLEQLADAQLAGLLLGARVPIIINGRTENMIARLGSCALALLLVRSKQVDSASIGAALTVSQD